jgi:hypothetical protein
MRRDNGEIGKRMGEIGRKSGKGKREKGGEEDGIEKSD